MTIIHKVPIPPPHRETPPRPTLTEEQEEKYQKILEHFSAAEYVVPGVEDGKGSLIDAEKFWLTRECLLRFLRGTKWDVPGTITRLGTTLKWRRDFGFYDKLTPEYVEPEGLTGKEIVFGFDVNGRPAIYMLPSRQNTDGSTTEGQRKQLEYAFWMVERCFDLFPPGVESVALMIDYADKAKSPSISTARLTLNYLQNHYPERLGRAMVLNLPYLATLFFKAVMPFVDPVTREKIKFNPKVIDDGLFEAHMVTTSWGGDVEIPYEHEVYWPALAKLSAERRALHMIRWRDMGGTVGVSEWDIFQEPPPDNDEKPAIPMEVDEKKGEEKADEAITRDMEKLKIENDATEEPAAIPVAA